MNSCKNNKPFVSLYWPKKYYYININNLNLTKWEKAF